MGPTKRGFVLFGVDQMAHYRLHEGRLASHQKVMLIIC